MLISVGNYVLCLEMSIYKYALVYVQGYIAQIRQLAEQSSQDRRFMKLTVGCPLEWCCSQTAGQMEPL